MGKAEEKHQSQRLGAKFDHLRIKHSKSLKERASINVPYKPKWKDKYPAAVYSELDDPEEFKKLLVEIDKERDLQEVMVLGGVAVSDEEKSVLRMHPSTGVLRKPDAREFALDEEVMLTKTRFGMREVLEHDRDWVEGIEIAKYWDWDELEKIKRAEAEASLRQVFDPLNGTMDFGNAWVNLPKELGAE